MARTRAAASKLTDGGTAAHEANRELLSSSAEAPTTDKDDQNDVDLPHKPIRSPSTFSGKLEQFHYGDTTSPNSSAVRAAITTGTRSSTSLKRTLASQTEEVRATSSPSPASKKRRVASKYAPPSKYSHLKPLTDILEPNLICVF
ncbi:hypothetical protein LTS18_013065, partial [Coniosporium uncinatum]